MARCNDLRLLPFRYIGQQLVGLPLAKDLKVRVGLIKKQDGPGICIEVREQQEGLLESAARARKIQHSAIFLIFHHNFTALFKQFWLSQFDAEQRANLRHNAFPRGWALFGCINLVAEIAQDLCCLPLPDQEADFSLLLDEFAVRQSRHRWQVRDLNLARGLRYFRKFRQFDLYVFVSREPQRTTYERLFIGKVEFEAATPFATLSNS